MTPDRVTITKVTTPDLYDPSRALETLITAGWPEPEAYQIIVTELENPKHRPYLQAIREQPDADAVLDQMAGDWYQIGYTPPWVAQP